MPVLLSLLLRLLPILPIAYLSMLAHEAGHAILGRLAGYRVTSVGAGTGRIFFARRFRGGPTGEGGTVVYLGWENPLQGITWIVYPSLFASRRPSALVLLGGPLTNLLIAGCAMAVYRFMPEVWQGVLHPLILINLLFGVGNLVPLTISIGGATIRSDGAQLVGVLRPTGAHRPVASPGSLLALRSLWLANGDHTQILAYLLTATGVCYDLRDYPAARHYLCDARALPVPESLPAFAVYLDCLEGLLLQAEGDTAAGDTLLADGARRFAEMGNEAGRVWAESGRRDPDSLARLTVLEQSHVLDEHPSIALSVAAAHVRLAAEGDRPETETALAHYEAQRRRFRYDPSDLTVYEAVARYRGRRDDWGGAAIAYESAAIAARRLFEALESDPEAQDRFASQIQPLVGEAAGVHERLGRPDEAARTRQLLPDVSEATRQREEARTTGNDREGKQRKKEKQQLVTGLLLTAGNVAVGALLFAGTAFAASRGWLSSDSAGSIAVAGALAAGGSVGLCLLVLLVGGIRWLATRKPIYASGIGSSLVWYAVLIWLLAGYGYLRAAGRPANRRSYPLTRRTGWMLPPPEASGNLTRL